MEFVFSQVDYSTPLMNSCHVVKVEEVSTYKHGLTLVVNDVVSVIRMEA